MAFVYGCEEGFEGFLDGGGWEGGGMGSGYVASGGCGDGDGTPMGVRDAAEQVGSHGWNCLDGVGWMWGDVG